MIDRIRRIFELELPVRSVFDEPTIAGLAVELQKAQALGVKAPTPIVRRNASSATTGASREAILSQLDNLSAAELQSLLTRVLDGKAKRVCATTHSVLFCQVEGYGRRGLRNF